LSQKRDKLSRLPAVRQGFCKTFLHSREHSIRGHHRDPVARFAPPRRPAPSLSLLQSGSSLKTPIGCFSNARPSTGQFLNARPWLVPGRYPDSATLLQSSLLPAGRQALSTAYTLYCRAFSLNTNSNIMDSLLKQYL
jgi:hypothetical protein